MTGSVQPTATPAGVTLGGAVAPVVAATSVPVAGNTAPATGVTIAAPATGSPTAAEDAKWFSGLNEDNRKFAESKGWVDVNASLTSHRELEVAFSKKGSASQAPASSADYKFTVPADLPKEVGYNAQFADWFKETAHKAGASQDVAVTLHDSFINFAKQNATAAQAAHSAKLGQDVTAAQTDLSKAWGPEGSPTFSRNLEMAKRAIRMLDSGLMDSLKARGAVATVNGQDTIVDSTLFKAYAIVGTKMFAEDSLFGEVKTNTNPFDAKTEDRALQARLVKDDPERAELLIRSAGPDVERTFAHFLAQRKGPVRR